MKKFFTQS